MEGAAIVIVTHNSADVIGPCLDAALRYSGDVIVVDNASQDGTLSAIGGRPVRRIANPSNLGFAAAVNQGVEATGKPFVLLLNPDCVLLTPLDPLCEAVSDPSVAAAGGKLIDTSGRPQTGFNVRRLPTPASLIFESLLINRLWPGNPINWRYRCMEFDPSTQCDVEQPAGALLMLRRGAWERLLGFDLSFFPLWFEDVDFCRRAKDDGWRVVYVPRVVARHSGGHSVAKLAADKRQLYWYGSLLMYAAKHFRRRSAWAVGFSVLVGALARMAAGILIDRRSRAVEVYREVVRLAANFLLRGARAR